MVGHRGHHPRAAAMVQLHEHIPRIAAPSGQHSAAW